MNAPAPAAKQRLVVGISGASGVILGIRLLEYLQHSAEYEAHLVLSAAAKTTMAAETDWAVKDVEALAAHVYDNRDIGAAPASGSFPTRGMVIRLSEALEVPRAERNVLLEAAGFAGVYALRTLAAEDMASIRAALEWVASMGVVSVTGKAGDEVTLGGGQQTGTDDPAQTERMTRLLIETAAYRAHYRRATARNLF